MSGDTSSNSIPPAPGGPPRGGADDPRSAALSMALPLALMILIMGLNYPIVKLGLPYAPALWLAFLRAALGAGTVWLLLLLRPRGTRLSSAKRQRALLLGLPNTFLYFGLTFWALTLVPPGTASVLASTVPLWVLVAAILLGVRPSLLKGVALGVGFAGILVVAGGHTALGGALLLPDLALIAAAVSWALCTVAMKRWFLPEELPEANAWQLVGGILPLLLLAWVGAPPTTVEWTPTLVAAVVWLGVVGTGVAFTLWFALLARGKASTITGYLFLVPVVSIAVSVVAFGEMPTLLEASGVVLILVATVLLSRADREPAVHHPLPAH